MKTKPYFVFDTNVLISAFLLPRSKSREALNRATLSGQLTISDATLNEFSEVLFRKKFDKYFPYEEERMRIIDKLTLNATLFTPTQTIRACRDPRDDMFLELAVAAQADCIVTSDKALLELHPFQNIPILSPAEFLTSYE